MSVKLNSTIDDRSSSTFMDAQGSEPVAGDEFMVPVTQMLLEVRSVCGSNAAESTASMAGLSFPSSDDAVCSGSKARAVTDAIS